MEPVKSEVLLGGTNQPDREVDHPATRAALCRHASFRDILTARSFQKSGSNKAARDVELAGAEVDLARWIIVHERQKQQREGERKAAQAAWEAEQAELACEREEARAASEELAARHKAASEKYLRYSRSVRNGRAEWAEWQWDEWAECSGICTTRS